MIFAIRPHGEAEFRHGVDEELQGIANVHPGRTQARIGVTGPTPGRVHDGVFDGLAPIKARHRRSGHHTREAVGDVDAARPRLGGSAALSDDEH